MLHSLCLLLGLTFLLSIKQNKKGLQNILTMIKCTSLTGKKLNSYTEIKFIKKYSLKVQLKKLV